MGTAGGRGCGEEIKKVVKPADRWSLYLFFCVLARFYVFLTVCNFNKYLYV